MTALFRRVLALSFVLTLLGCSGEPEDTPEVVPPVPVVDEQESAEESPEEPAPELREIPIPTDDDPLAGLDDPDFVDALLPMGTSLAPPPTEIPDGGCATFGDAPLPIWPNPGLAEVVAVGEDGFAIAGYATGDAGEEVFLVTVSPGRQPRLVLRELLERPLRTQRVAPPGLGAIDGGHVGLAITDLGARVLYDEVQLGGRRRGFEDIGHSVDQRFQPAVGVRGSSRMIAYTDGGQPRTKVWLIQMDGTGAVLGQHDITPPGLSARAPSFVNGQVAFIDAREGTSTVFVQPLGDNGTPTGSANVLTPLTNLYDPIAFSVVPVLDQFAVAYTSVGRAAMTAVGLVRVGDDGPSVPIAIVPSAGYGALHVDATGAPSGVVFVGDASKGEDRDASREVVVRLSPAAAVSDASRMSEALVLRGPDGTAHHGRIARRGRDYAVVFGSGDGIYAYFLRCDPSP